MKFDPSSLSRYPKDPGVYLMKNGEGVIIYVGKANSLKVRLKQYFGGSDGRAIIPLLLDQIASIDTIIVSSEKEALLLENTLIKKHQPKYNALLKDDKTYCSLAINYKHRWPMVRIVRYKGKPPPDALYFGPYTNGHAARQTVDLIRHLFPLRQCSDRELVNRSRPCILYELKQCLAPCVSKCTKEEYDTVVQRVIHFLRGHDSIVVQELKEEMEKAIEDLEFERAETIHLALKNIEATLEKQNVEKARGEDLDVIGLFRLGSDVVLTQVFFREGKIIGKEDHFFDHNAQEDEELLSSFLLQEYQDLASLPKEILIPYEVPESETIASLLSEGKKRSVEIHVPLRGNKKSLLEIARKNAEAHFQRAKEHQSTNEQLLMALEEKCQLTNYPERIECFDNSNISGTEPVSAMVVFTAGQKDTKRYRKYKIKTADPSDDYGALREVLTRRYAKAIEEDDLPDLLLIDGGKGHLQIAVDVLKQLNIITVDVISLAKEEGKHTKGMTAERIFLQQEEYPLLLRPHSPLLLFLQQIRDEAHRVAISFHRQRRSKKSLSSALDTIPGIGPIKRKRLLSHFGSMKRILEASEDEWKKVPGITKRDIETLKNMRPD